MTISIISSVSNTWNLLGTFSFWEGTPMMKSSKTMTTIVRKTAKSLMVERT